jgi:hypothetical protein
MSNVTKPWRVAKKWCERVTSEFFQQGDLERKRDLTVKNKTSVVSHHLQIVLVHFVSLFLFSPLLIWIERKSLRPKLRSTLSIMLPDRCLMRVR